MLGNEALCPDAAAIEHSQHVQLRTKQAILKKTCAQCLVHVGVAMRQPTKAVTLGAGFGVHHKEHRILFAIGVVELLELLPQVGANFKLQALSTWYWTVPGSLIF